MNRLPCLEGSVQSHLIPPLGGAQWLDPTLVPDMPVPARRLLPVQAEPPLRGPKACIPEPQQEAPVPVEQASLAQGRILCFCRDVMQPQLLKLAGLAGALIGRTGKLLHGSQRFHIPSQRARKGDLLDTLSDLRRRGWHPGSN